MHKGQLIKIIASIPESGQDHIVRSIGKIVPIVTAHRNDKGKETGTIDVMLEEFNGIVVLNPGEYALHDN